MDWHFQVRQRMAEAEKRGQYRSHYVSKQVSDSGILSERPSSFTS